MRLKLQSVLYILFLPLFLYAQNTRRLSENEGLPQSFISGLHQDKQGFIWIATRNGLARYDGHNFRIFQHDLSDKNSLASNAITHLQPGPGNSLWLKYETGELDRLSIDSAKVSHIITQDISEKEKLFIIRRGWSIADDNVIWYLGKGGTVKSFKYQHNGKIKEKRTYSFQGDTIRSLFIDGKKDLWVLRQNALSRLIKGSSRFIDYPLQCKQYFNDNLDYGDDIPELHKRANGELMWTDLKNIFFFEPKSHRFRKISLPEVTEYSVKWINIGPDGKEYFIAGNNVYSYDDNNGLKKYAKDGLEDFRNIQAFLVDRSGLIWTGGNTDGITQIDLATDFDSHRYEKDFITDVLTRAFNFPVAYLAHKNSYKGTLPLSYYLRTVKDANNIWIALDRAVYRYDIRQKKVTGFELPAANKKFVPVKGLVLMANGMPMVMDDCGSLYTLQSSGVWQLSTPFKTAGNYSLKTVAPSSILLDKTRLWVATEYDGLFYIDLKSKTLHKVNDKEGKVFSARSLYNMLPDPAGNNLIWIGSPQGLLCFNKTTFKTNVFSVKQGLPDNVVYSMLPDAAGYLWLGTNKGLVRFDPVSHKSRTFTVSYGLPNNEFNRFHQIPLPDGKLAFGGINGYVIFNPQEIKDDNFNPNVELTDIFINNQAIEGTAYASALPLLTNLSLPYNDNTLRIEYAALQFNHPTDIKYRYRLKGYDNKWVAAANKRDAVYTKIPPGKYVFEVNATNTTGKWSSYIKSLPVTVSPPWWNTTGAWILYLILFAVSVLLFTNFRIRQRVMKEEIVLKQKEALHLRELDDMKTRFFSNITHELRTPLTLILGPAQELKTRLFETEQGKMAEIITKNATSLLNLTNQLLDMSKLEAGALKPHFSAGDLTQVMRKVVAAFSQEANSKDIVITQEMPGNAGYLFDAEMMERILFNLLSNAIRFSPQGGSIVVKLDIVPNGIVLSVSDNGPGVTKEDILNIFNRFYRGNSAENRSATGSGIGLSLVKELITLQGGTINVSTNPLHTTGAVFEIFLPLKELTTTIAGEAAQNTVAVFVEDHTAEKPTVLVVEDNKELAAFMYSILNAHYNVVAAENGIAALPLAQQYSPEIIISDVLMPVMDGFEFCRAVKADIATSHIPVLLLTAKADMESRLEGLSYGADDYLTKPFSVEELLMRVSNRLVQQKLLRESIYRGLTTLPAAEEVVKSKPVDPFLLKIYEAVDENIDNDNFGVEELSAVLLISRTSLHRKIKSITGMSTSEMLRAYRLSKALPLLKENFTVAEVAYKTGFASPSYFTRSFKEVYGITPSDFLKTAV